MLLDAADRNKDRAVELHLALRCACEFGYVNMMYLLLEHGAEVQRPGEGPLIHRVLTTDNVEIISTLIARGIDIEARDWCGYTALLHALFLGLPIAVCALLAAGKCLLILIHLGANVHVSGPSRVEEAVYNSFSRNPDVVYILLRTLFHRFF